MTRFSSHAVSTARAIAVGAFLGCAVALLSANTAGAGGFQADDATTTPQGHFEIDVANLYSRTKSETTGALTSLEVDYGAAENIELHLYAPLAFDRKSPGGRTNYGYGDTELGVKYRFINQAPGEWWPAVAFFPLVELPTGEERRGLGTGHTHEFLPLWLEWDFGPWTIFGGFDYAINPGAGNKNYWEASQAIGYKFSDNLWMGAEIFHQTATADGQKPSTGFNVGGTYDFTENHHLVLTVGRGIQNPTRTNQFSSYLAYELTF